MGKYMKKGKITGDVAVMEIPQSASLGVRTRARTLALQPNPELSYLQLRSRRLEKPPFQPKPESSRVRVIPGSTRSESAEVRVGGIGKEAVVGRCHTGEIEEFYDVGGEASCGENNLEFDSRERSTRESTPCSFIRDLEPIGTPGSTTSPTCSSRRPQNTQRAVPTTPEMEEFFAGFELQQQKHFMDRYNYDIMNDLPLQGRYEWVRVDN